MGLLSRLVAPAEGEEKLPGHTFLGAVAELKRGAPGVTVEAIAQHPAFNLSPSEEAELEAFVTTLYIDGVSRELIHDVIFLGELGVYTLETCEDRLQNLVSPTDALPLIVQRQLEVLKRSFLDCVLSGCAVTAQGSPNMTLAVAKGAVLAAGVLRAVTAGNVTITAAHASFPRLDVVVVDSTGVKAVRAGTAATRPQPPALNANDVALAFVYVPPGDTAVTSDQFLDARVFRNAGPVVVGKITTPVVRNNTNAAQTFISLVMPSGLFLAGKILRVRCGGTMLLNSGSPTVTLAITYGGTTMFSDVSTAATADADRLAWTLEFELVATANNDQGLSGRLDIGPVAAKTAPANGVGDMAVPAALASSPVPAPFSGSAAVDSDAADRTLAVQWTMSVGNPANEIAMEYATGELL